MADHRHYSNNRWDYVDSDYVSAYGDPFNLGLGIPLETGLASSPGVIGQLDAKARFDAENEAASQAASVTGIGAGADRNERSFGHVVKPRENSLRGYLYLLRHPEYRLAFSPVNYPQFDERIVQAFGVDGIGTPRSAPFNAQHADYAEFDELRRNLAVLRNMLAVNALEPGQRLPNGSRDGRGLAQIGIMADKLGEKLAGNPAPTLVNRFFGNLKRLFSGERLGEPPNAFLQAANKAHSGIGVMYDYLLSLQRPKGEERAWWEALPFTPQKYDWHLPPRDEKSPFSQDDIEKYSRATSIIGIAEALDTVVHDQFQSIDVLSRHDKKISIQHARTILAKLAHSVENPDYAEERSRHTDPSKEEAEMMLSVATGFKGALQKITRHDAALLHDPALNDAAEALGIMALRVQIKAVQLLERDGEAIEAGRMRREFQTRLSEHPDYAHGAPMHELLQCVDKGLLQSDALLARLEPTGPKPASLDDTLRKVQDMLPALAALRAAKEPPASAVDKYASGHAAMASGQAR